MPTERTLPKSTITERRRDGSVGMKYKPMELIGSGGSAIAFSATVLDVNENPTDQICLLKEFYPTGASRDENDAVSVPFSNTNKALRIQFLREVSAGKEASQYIYGVTTATNSFESENGNTYIVMTYEKHGMSLKNFCEWLNENGKTIPMRAWARLFHKLSDRIRNLHENAGILHSDISIGNVMIMQSDDPEVLYEYVCSENADYTVILLDFGCAYSQDDVYIYDGSDILTAEKRDVVFTTNEFASLELLNDTCREITTFTDIYSIVACFKYCINAVESGDTYIFSADIPATAKAQVEKILGTLNADESEYVYKTRVLIEMFDELIRRIDGKGISKAILWETGNKDISSFKRSADFDIVESILPSGRKSVQQTEYAHLEGSETKKLEDLITETKGSTYLIGEGGIGKTTSLIHYADGIYQKGYTEESVVPVYIELGNCTMDNAGLSSKLIHRYILSRMTGATLAAVSDEQISELSKLFSAEKSQPEYILMLDGLNEVSDRKSYRTDGSADRSIVTLLIYEITQMIQNCKNVRVILTSRNDNESLSDSSFQRIYITGLKDEEVNQFLSEAKISDEKRQAAKNNPTLMEILRIPLFLSIYTRIADNIDTTEMSTRGELLKAFFNEKRNDIYSQINRVDKLHNLPLTGEQYAFILSYVLPQICWEMVQKRTMELDSETIYDLIYKAVSDDQPMYIGFGVRSSIRRTAASLKQVEDEAVRSDPLAAPILNAIKNTLSVFYKKSEDSETKEEILRIRHQHFRDYFAALYFIGLMKSARSSMARMKGDTDEAFGILQEIRDEVVFPDVLIFVGEILGEHKNAPVLVDGKWNYNVPPINDPQDRNLIKRTLDVFRGRFDSSVGYVVYNLVEVLKKVRKDIGGADCSFLDLSNISFNGVDLGERGGGALMTGAKIGYINLFPVGHSDYVNSSVYNHDATRIVTASRDGTAKMWDAKTGALLLELKGQNSEIHYAQFNHDGTRIVTASADRRAKIWDAETGEMLLNIKGHSDSVKSAMFNHDDTRIVTASDDGTTKVWDAETGEMLLNLEGHSSIVNSAMFNHDSTRIVTASDDGTAKVWDAKTGEMQLDLKGHRRSVNSAVYNCDADCIVTASDDRSVKIWDAKTGKCLLNLWIHSSEVNYAQFNPDSTRIVTASADKTVKVWHTETGTMLLELKGYSNSVESAIFNHDGTQIVTTSTDGTKVWDVETGALLLDLMGQKNKIWSATYNHDCTRIVTALDDGTAKVWNAETRMLLLTLKGHCDLVSCAEYNNDGTRIITASDDGTAKVWDTENGEMLLDLKGHCDSVRYAMYNKNPICIIAVPFDRTSRIWNAKTGALLLNLRGHHDYVKTAMYSPNGTLIVTASFDCSAKVWDAESGKMLVILKGHRGLVTSAMFNRDATCIVTASTDGTAKVWNIESRRQLLNLKGHRRDVYSAKYNHNGTRIVTASFDGTAKVWDAKTGELLLNLIGHNDIVLSANYNHYGTHIVTASSDGTVKLWDAQTCECLDTIKNTPGLMVKGVDLQHLHPDCTFSDEDKEILRRYGAII